MALAEKKMDLALKQMELQAAGAQQNSLQRLAELQQGITADRSSTNAACLHAMNSQRKIIRGPDGRAPERSERLVKEIGRDRRRHWTELTQYTKRPPLEWQPTEWNRIRPAHVGQAAVPQSRN